MDFLAVRGGANLLGRTRVLDRAVEEKTGQDEPGDARENDDAHA